MMEIEAIKIYRRGCEDCAHAEVVIEVQDTHGEWREIGSEQIGANFSSTWSLPASWRHAHP